MRNWKFLRGEVTQASTEASSFPWLVAFSGVAFLGTFATFPSHARLSYSNAYKAYDNGVEALSEIVVD